MIVSASLRELILEHARQRQPEEIGGLLTHSTKIPSEVVGYEPLTNVAPVPSFCYVPAPSELLAVLSRAERFSFFHSHNGPARPSGYDRDAFRRPWMAGFAPFLILGFEQGEPVFRCFDVDAQELQLD